MTPVIGRVISLAAEVIRRKREGWGRHQGTNKSPTLRRVPVPVVLRPSVSTSSHLHHPFHYYIYRQLYENKRSKIILLPSFLPDLSPPPPPPLLQHYPPISLLHSPSLL